MTGTSKISFPRREAAKARTRVRIENAARRLFLTEGYHDATMAAIAEAADIHITTLFTHFASKRDLAASLAISSGERFQAVVLEQRAAGVPVLQFWRAQVMRIARAYDRDADGQINLSRALADEPDLLPIWSAQQQLQVDLLTDYIADELGLDAQVDGRPEMAAAMLVAGGRMAFDRWVARGRGDDLVAENERLLAAAVAVLTQGLPLLARD
jgi:AcrR family transcriptional regulator